MSLKCCPRPLPHALPPSFTQCEALMGPAMVAHRLRGSAAETTEVLVPFLAICNGCRIYKKMPPGLYWQEHRHAEFFV